MTCGWCQALCTSMTVVISMCLAVLEPSVSISSAKTTTVSSSMTSTSAAIIPLILKLVLMLVPLWLILLKRRRLLIVLIVLGRWLLEVHLLHHLLHLLHLLHKLEDDDLRLLVHHTSNICDFGSQFICVGGL